MKDEDTIRAQYAAAWESVKNAAQRRDDVARLYWQGRMTMLQYVEAESAVEVASVRVQTLAWVLNNKQEVAHATQET